MNTNVMQVCVTVLTFAQIYCYNLTVKMLQKKEIVMETWFVICEEQQGKQPVEKKESVEATNVD